MRTEDPPEDRQKALVDKVDFDQQPDIVAAVATTEPGFLKKGKYSFLTLLREAANFRELRRTPYRLKPVLIFTIIGAAAAFDGRIFGQAAPEIIRDLEVDLVPLFQVSNIIGFFLVFVIIGLSYYADRVRRIPFVGIGAIIAGVFSLFTARATNLVTLGASRVGDSVGGEILTTPIASLQADYYPPETRGKVFALQGVIGRVVGLATPLAVAYIVVRWGWRTPFLIGGPLMIAAGILAMIALREPIRGYMERKSLGVSEEEARKPEEPPSLGEAWRTIWSIRTLRRLFIATIPGSAGDTTFSFFWGIFLFSFYHLDITERALIGSLLGLATLPFGFLSGGVLDVLLRRRPQRVLVFSGILGVISGAFLFLAAAGPPLWLLIGSLFLFSAAGALIGPAHSVLFVQILPAHVRTLGASVTLLATLPATIIRFLVVGELADRYGVQGAMFAAAPFILLSALIELSAAGLFERDMRSAMASQLASEEWRRARDTGKGKMLVCRDVDVEYNGVQVLFGVDFDVEEGQLIALLGTNGAGKSTLLRAISGTQESSSGAVVFDGRDITHMPPHEVAARGVIHVPGGRGVFPDLTVRENLTLGNWMTEDREVKARLKQVLEVFPILKQRMGDRAGILSGGEQQMLSLAQAFLSRPRLLMIDELSLGLSPAVVQQLIEVVRAIHKQGTTIILVEQSVNVALTVAEKAIFMEKGEVRFFGETKELLRRPDILRAVYVKGTGALVEGAPAAALKSERERRVYGLTQSRNILEVRNLSKSYGGVQAVSDVSFDLREGEVLGLIGPNGAGKTTIFDLISGYQLPDGGSIMFDGQDITGLGPDERARRRLVRRFQDARLFPALTVYENILVSLERKLESRSMVFSALQLPQVRQSERRVRRRADGLVDLMELGSYRDKFVKELSTGLRRITDLACVLATEPKVLLLDEPSTGIAQAESESLAPLLRRISFETACSMLVIEHDMALISSITDEMIALDQGVVVMRGTPEEVLNDERVIESYLGTTEETIQRSGLVTPRKPA